MNNAQVRDFLLQALETEIGGVRIYRTALECVDDAVLRDQWCGYLEESETHVEILEHVCRRLGIDTRQETPGRAVVRDIGDSLERAMRTALATRGEGEAGDVAAQCVDLAESTDRQHRRLLGNANGKRRPVEARR